jgi:DNA-binding transcriptional LysR family regulator
MRSLDVSTDKLPVPLDDVAADDHRLDIRRPGAEDHDRDRVAESIEVWRAHVHDRDVGLLARCQAANLVLETPLADEMPGMTAETVAHVDLVFVGAPDGPLSVGPVDPEALDELTLIDTLEGFGRIFLAQFGAAHESASTPNVLELGHPEAAKLAVAQGSGVTVLPRAAVHHEIATGTLSEIEWCEPPGRAPVRLVYRTEKKFSPAQQQLIAAVRQELWEATEPATPRLALAV